jgi:hypothetical protein
MLLDTAQRGLLAQRITDAGRAEFRAITCRIRGPVFISAGGFELIVGKIIGGGFMSHDRASTPA